MQGLKGITESMASGLAVLYNATLPMDVLLSLRRGDHSFDTLMWPTFHYVVVLSIIAALLFIYYYMWLPVNWVKDLTDIGHPHMKGRRSKKELQRRRQLGDLPPVYPNGWFTLLESRDLKAGQVKHVQALGENFAVMRSSKGEVHVLDAYCPHLGANMVVGGVVKGDCLECPFHGWKFRGDDGTCSHIPYSDKVPKSAAVKKWTSNEVNGFVFVWYHAEGEPPSWQVESIPEIETGKLWYRGRIEMLVNCHIQDIAENPADLSHLNVIHKPSIFDGPDISSYNSLTHSFLKHVWTASWTQHSTPGEIHMGTQRLSQSLKLFNKFTLLTTDITLKQFGPGYDVVTNTMGYALFTQTPVEPLMMRIVYHFYVHSPLSFLISRIVLYGILTTIGPGYAVLKNNLGYIVVTKTSVEPLLTWMVYHVYVHSPLVFLVSEMILNGILITLERDVMVWQNKKYMMKPQLVKEDEALAKHRRWYSQFYTANSPRFSFKQNSTEW